MQNPGALKRRWGAKINKFEKHFLLGWSPPNIFFFPPRGRFGSPSPGVHQNRRSNKSNKNKKVSAFVGQPNTVFVMVLLRLLEKPLFSSYFVAARINKKTRVHSEIFFVYPGRDQDRYETWLEITTDKNLFGNTCAQRHATEGIFLIVSSLA